MNPNEKRLGQYLIDQGIELENATVRTVAKEVFLAPSSVVRFVQKLGFEGFNDFKKQYLEEIRYLSTHFQKIDSNRPFSQNDKNIVIANKEDYFMMKHCRIRFLYSIMIHFRKPSIVLKRRNILRLSYQVPRRELRIPLKKR